MVSTSRNRHVAIAPSILNSNLTRLHESIARLEDAQVEYIHLDIMDGMFVPNISIGIPVVESIRRETSLALDVHLMVEQPERYIEAFHGAGANVITIHIEATRHPHRTLQAIRELGSAAGIALNPSTPVSHAVELLDVADLVLVMSVNPGFGGQRFINSSLRRIREARGAIDARGLHTLLEVDGGVSAANAREVVQAGADILVAGTAVFGSTRGVVEGVAALREAVS
jgi:ribulose-phosphate 3-epimerase